MANKSVTQFRVHEIEPKADFRSVIRATNFDSKYYLNDKDAPPEDTFDYSGLADPTKFYSSCTPSIVMYKMSILFSGDWISQESWINITETMTVPPIITQQASNGQPQYTYLALIGTLTKPTSLNVQLIQQHRDQSIGNYITNNSYHLWHPIYCATLTGSGPISFTGRGDTVRDFSNGSTSIPGFMKPMQKSGSFTWTDPALWVKGLDICYIPANSNAGGSAFSLKCMQDRARVPNESSYYWLLVNMANWWYFYASPLNQAQPASARFTPVVS